jgi:hypothetical protein
MHLRFAETIVYKDVLLQNLTYIFFFPFSYFFYKTERILFLKQFFLRCYPPRTAKDYFFRVREIAERVAKLCARGLCFGMDIVSGEHQEVTDGNREVVRMLLLFFPFSIKRIYNIGELI